MGIKDMFVKPKNKTSAPEPFKLPPRTPQTHASDMKSSVKDEMDFLKMPEIGGMKTSTPPIPKPEPLMQPKPMGKPLEVAPKRSEELPVIKDIRRPEPHLFIKVDKYTDVKASVKKMGERLKDLTATLEKMENLKDEEVKKIEILKGTMKKMSDIVTDLEKTFKDAREDYE